MRVYWILSSISLLISLGLFMVILGQQREMEMITMKNKELNWMSEKFYKKLQQEDDVKDLLQSVVTKGQTKLKDLEAEIANLGLEVETKKTDADACQAEMKTKKDEVDSIESDRSKTTDSLKAEADPWNKEIDSLKNQLKENPKICEYVAADKKAKELCNKKSATD
ncbi:uncharacterized protein zgc:174935 [Melanotaenia boesemani]|uniref:uncharacterized protein zgc:174935 n=1 Tax=Melanotaenia boesemani TaxID=1250792 RepID=UPI001C03FF3F|nr:uncharacterized protein zgc:174935 [Melanotaenia boesemani]XP_041867223.1 uncharacterized protein zgc:174935 [Melanotaenia boesemani]XP_041867224.1 uncharacterized protein zgc:174935 [Melanotaenia boesemani]